MTEEERDRLRARMSEGQKRAEEEGQLRRRTDEKPSRLALWVGLATLFTNLAAIQIVILIGSEDDPWAKAIGAVTTAFIVAGAAYAKQRRDDELDRRKRCKNLP